MARTYKRDSQGRFAGGGNSSYSRDRPGAAQRRSAGQAAYMSGRIEAASWRTSKGPHLSDQQRKKAAAAREQFGVHAGRKDGLHKVKAQQAAKATLAKKVYGKRSTNPTKSGGGYPAPKRLSIKNGIQRAASAASLKAMAAGQGDSKAFRAGLKAGNQAIAQRSLNRKAGKAIGRPIRSRR